jgi:hypothetical protein
MSRRKRLKQRKKEERKKKEAVPKKDLIENIRELFVLFASFLNSYQNLTFIIDILVKHST